MMTRSPFRNGLVAALCLLVSAVSAQSPTSSSAATAVSATTAPKAIQTLGCYSSAGSLVQQGAYTYQTSGYCQVQCANMNKPVMAITQGSTCYCGDEIPAQSDEADSSSCNSPCNGFDQQTCGGNGFWQVYLTGLSTNVPTAANGTSSSSSSSGSSSSSSSSSSSVTTSAPATTVPAGGTPATQPSTITKAGQTIIVTASASSSAAPEQNKNSGGGGGSKVGIAVGVVVGVIALAAVAGAIILVLRRKRNKAIEEEHRRNAAVSKFGAAGKAESMASSQDQRLDPSVFSHRRQSIGSIADERDFSRRILQVRNPDRESKASNMA